MMNDCIFCRIASGEQPCLKVYEDASAVAFMDIAGDVDGHMLVIPKSHCVSIMDCEHDMLRAAIQATRRVCLHLTEHCGYEGVDILSANGEAAGQTMPHFHIHLIPRRRGDGLGGAGEWPCFPGAKEDLLTMHQRLKMEQPNE